MLKLSTKLVSHFEDFRRQNIFSDISLIINDNVYMSHKIILSYFSPWFYQYFKDNPRCTEIVFKDEFGDHFEDIFDYFYSQKIFINSINFAEYAHIASYFNIFPLQKVIIQKFPSIVTDVNILSIFRSLNHYKLFDLSRLLLPMITKLYWEQRSITRSQLIQSLVVPILVPLLDEPYFRDLSVYERIEFINDAVKDQILSEEDKDFLQTAINFNNPDVLSAFSRSFFDWIPIKYQRQLIDQLFQKKYTLFKEFSIESIKQNDQESYDRWYPFSFFSNISNCNKENKALHLISTLGNSVNRIDPIKFGLIRANSTPPILPKYSISSIFSSNSFYFMSSKMQDIPPSIEFIFGSKSKFFIQKIKISSNIKNCHHKSQPYPNSLIIYSNSAEDPQKEIFQTKIDMNNGEYSGNITCDIPLSSIGIKMIEDGQKGTSILRISNIEFEGNFLP